MADQYPSLLWIAIPSVLLVSGYFGRKWYLARKLRVHGIGKGAPGFQTGVRKVRVPPEIMERIQRGEEVSAEEITAALARKEAEERGDPVVAPDSPRQPKRSATKSTLAAKEKPSEPVDEWLPETITGPKKRAKGKKK
ncbi:hypothetical protein GGX14DRAFT_361766 [Mycena pura]|uniref:Uncharacterized protein n=1 Tax=Mycena pura TaxID=153505 RepID=A0AAD6VNW4_9AGAR|nr:hypothetical protein GGX14DRAFT_361766 [Mycena pura]